MPISESKLIAWTTPGALTGSAAAHTSIKAALDAHSWPDGMSFETYLQGSYGNHTNIRGNSDVDLVVQAVGSSNGPFYCNLTDAEKAQLSMTSGAFGFDQFRAEVRKALVAYYGAPLIDATTSDKCITVKAASGRLEADVIPCLEYRRYNGATVIAYGMSFFTTSGTQVVNYPKLHKKRGEDKNSNVRAAGKFKDMVRIFKNAREHVPGNFGDHASYFIECLLFNVPDDRFKGTYAQAFYAVLVYVQQANLSNFRTQSDQEDLFGASGTQWDVTKANAFIAGMARLWNTS